MFWHQRSGVLATFLIALSTFLLFNNAHSQRWPNKIRHRCIITSTCLRRKFHLNNLQHLPSCSGCDPSQAMSGEGNNGKESMERATRETIETSKIVDAASAASTPPPPYAGTKPSTSRNRTPTQQSSRNKKPTTPTTPGFKSRKRNTINLKKVQRDAPKEDLDTAKVARAATLFKKNPSQRLSQ